MDKAAARVKTSGMEGRLIGEKEKRENDGCAFDAALILFHLCEPCPLRFPIRETARNWSLKNENKECDVSDPNCFLMVDDLARNSSRMSLFIEVVRRVMPTTICPVFSSVITASFFGVAN